MPPETASPSGWMATILPAVFLSEPDPEGLRQINAMLPSGAQPGDCGVSVGFGGAVSAPVAVRLV